MTLKLFILPTIVGLTLTIKQCTTPREQRVVLEYFDAYNRHDVEGMSELLGDTISNVELFRPEPHVVQLSKQ